MRSDTSATPATTSKRLAQVPLGHLYVEGRYFREHLEAVEQLIDREAERALDDDPPGRIVSRALMAPGELVVATTTERLASRLARALHDAYAGTITCRFNPESRLVRVTWCRE